MAEGQGSIDKSDDTHDKGTDVNTDTENEFKHREHHFIEMVKTNRGTRFCSTCLYYLSERRADIHKKAKETHWHNVLEFKDIPCRAQQVLQILGSATSCPIHPDKEFKFFCVEHDQCICCDEDAHADCDILREIVDRLDPPKDRTTLVESLSTLNRVRQFFIDERDLQRDDLYYMHTEQYYITAGRNCVARVFYEILTNHVPSEARENENAFATLAEGAIKLQLFDVMAKKIVEMEKNITIIEKNIRHLIDYEELTQTTLVHGTEKQIFIMRSLMTCMAKQKIRSARSSGFVEHAPRQHTELEKFEDVLMVRGAASEDRVLKRHLKDKTSARVTKLKEERVSSKSDRPEGLMNYAMDHAFAGIRGEQIRELQKALERVCTSNKQEDEEELSTVTDNRLCDDTKEDIKIENATMGGHENHTPSSLSVEKTDRQDVWLRNAPLHGNARNTNTSSSLSVAEIENGDISLENAQLDENDSVLSSSSFVEKTDNESSANCQHEGKYHPETHRDLEAHVGRDAQLSYPGETNSAYNKRAQHQTNPAVNGDMGTHKQHFSPSFLPRTTSQSPLRSGHYETHRTAGHCRPDFMTQRLVFVGKTHIDTVHCSILIMIALADGRLVLMDAENRINVFDETLTLLFSYRLPFQPCGICHLDGAILALAWAREKRITFFEIESYDSTLTNLYSLNLCRKCRAIANYHAALAVLFGEDGNFEIEIRKQNDCQILKTITLFQHGNLPVKMSPVSFLFSENQGFLVGDLGNRLICFDETGLQTWCYEGGHHARLGDVTGIAEDRMGNIYACSRRTANVHQISRNGTAHTRMLIPYRAHAQTLVIDRLNRLLIGCYDDDSVYMYSFENSD